MRGKNMSKNILIVAGHPDLKNDSLANKTIGSSADSFARGGMGHLE